jgi:predicted  nucleic acid-binding Zn-ribbon protein
LHEQLKLLIELQALDSSILSMDERIEQVPRQINQYKAPLKEAIETHQKTKLKYDALIKKKKDKDQKVEESQDKISKLKTRSGDIKTNKEFEAHKKEIDNFEKSIYKMEDEILADMENIELYENKLKEQEAEVKKDEDDLKQIEKQLSEEQSKLQGQLEVDRAKRNEFASKISKDYLHQYMVTLKRVGDSAVVETKNEICLGCNTNIPPQLYNDIRKSELIYTCFYCKRFLYFIEPSPPEDTPKEPPPAS